MYSFWLFFVACILHSTSVPDTNRTKRIVGGGFFSDLERTPYLGFLQYKDKNNLTQGCGATILSPKYILTAASCVKICRCGERMGPRVDDKDCPYCETNPPEDYNFYTGSAVLHHSEIYRSYISKWNIHPNYKYLDGENDCLLNNNIVVGELKEPLKFSKTINKVQLPEAITLDQVNASWKPMFGLPEDQLRAEVFGWGDVIGSGYDQSPLEGRQLKSVNLTLVDNDQCMSYLYASIENKTTLDRYARNFGLCYETYYCTIDPAFQAAPCIYDDGDPLIINNTQIGIVSVGFSRKCVGKYNPNGYTRVDIYVDWINSIIGDTTGFGGWHYICEGKYHPCLYNSVDTNATRINSIVEGK